jgi:hypothetical protein
MSLPKEYQILPYSIPFIIPGFEKTYLDGDYVLSLSEKDSKIWFQEFVCKIENGINKKNFLPICRMSDGEFIFCVGERLPSKRIGMLHRIIYFFRRKLSKAVKGSNFIANTLPNVPSGNYTQQERELALNQYAKNIKVISEKGILALDFTYWEKPFQEQYFNAFYKWMEKNNITINEINYFPFYFVYACLLGPEVKRILAGKKVLVIHSASGNKRNSIKNKLYEIGCLNVEWLEISVSRSLYDTIDLGNILEQPDIVLIGAGVGKPNIMVQLETLSVPVIDAGYVFEVWYDESTKWIRRYCVADDAYVPENVAF